MCFRVAVAVTLVFIRNLSDVPFGESPLYVNLNCDFPFISVDDTVLLKSGLPLEKRIRLKGTNSFPTEKGGRNENGSFFSKMYLFI